MEKMYIQRPPLGLERCFLQNLFSRIVLNPRQKPHLSDKQTHLSSFQSPTVWLTFQPSCPSTYQLNLFLTILYQTKAVSWEISGHPHRRGASHSGTACRLQEASSSHLSPCVSRLHQACRQPLLSPMSLIMTAPSLFFRSANDLPFASPTFLKVCLSELLADPCCQQVVLRGWFCPMIHGTEKLLSDVVVVFITINSKTDAYLEIWYESLTLPFLVTSRENIFHYFII